MATSLKDFGDYLTELTGVYARYRRLARQSEVGVILGESERLQLGECARRMRELGVILQDPARELSGLLEAR